MTAAAAGRAGPAAPPGPPVQVLGRVAATRAVGAYTEIVLAAPGVAAAARPGQFVALAVGGPGSPMLLRRSFALAAADPADPAGDGGGTVTVVLSVAGPGTAWLAERRVGDPVDVVGPLGRPWPLPAEPVDAVLVGGGYGTAPLLPLADALVAGGSTVRLVVGAATADRLNGVVEGRARGLDTTVTTDDGSAGERGRVTAPLAGLLAPAGERRPVVYACGPMAMLAAVSAAAADAGAEAWVAVEESMACGIGVCMTCVLPVVGDDGTTRMTRSCTEGPVFRGDRVRFDAVGTVPPGTLGAPAAGGVPAAAAGAPPPPVGAATSPGGGL